MAHNSKRGVRPAGRALDLLRDGKKTVLATALILVMAAMWIRVLIGHRPGSAAAATNRPQTSAASQKSPARSRAKMIALPRIAGRNDSIDRDCFNMQEWAPVRLSAAGPSASTDPEVPVVSPHHDQEVIHQVAQTLRLEAVSLKSESPRAFLNDRLLGVGDTLTVETGSASLEFEVLQIKEESVLVECNGIQLTLKLALVGDVRK
jgi:hypothetical protein